MSVRSVSFHARNTPLQPADRLGGILGFKSGRLWIKRDDMTGLAGGGNKARKLEYLVAAAQDRGCDTLVTGGAAQSNHVRMTAAASAAHGLRCVAVLFGSAPGRAEGNLLLDELFGAEVRFAGRQPPAEALATALDALRATGATPYEIPLGGSSPVGAFGYVNCAAEIDAGLAELGAPGMSAADALVVCADGSGGTHAGLVAGFGDHRRVLGVNVGFGDLGAIVSNLAADTAGLAGLPLPVGELQLDDGQPEPYGQPTEATREALWMAARAEGLVLDPVYTGRALAALIARCRSGSLSPDQTVVFLHTGGMPALFTDRYQPWFSVPAQRSTQ